MAIRNGSKKRWIINKPSVQINSITILILKQPFLVINLVLAHFLNGFCFIGSYFCYDNPAALEDVFEKGLNYTVTEFSLLYSVYSWPNVVLCFVGGYLIDRFVFSRKSPVAILKIMLTESLG